jgi:hypothetical protein
MQSFMRLERKSRLAKAPRPSGMVPETGLRSRRHHQHQIWVRRASRNAMKPRIQCAAF